MSAIEENNKMRTQQLGEMPASEMTKREKMATEILAGLSGRNDITIEQMLDHAIKLTDSLIEKLNK
jgi:hypothetical protein